MSEGCNLGLFILFLRTGVLAEILHVQEAEQASLWYFLG